jgi:hypothetical protein
MKKYLQTYIKSILLFTVLFSNVAFAEIKVKLHFSLIANLVYQLDCIGTDQIQCSRQTYEDLWNKTFYITDEDKQILKIWSEIKNRYHVEAEFQKMNNESTSGRYEGVQLSTKIRIASFQSSNMEDYFNRLDLIVLPKDREKFEKVIRHFYPRFKNWWDKVAYPAGNNFAQKTERLLKKPEISKKIKSFTNFYEAQLPDNYMIHFNLIFRPNFKESTSGQQIENYSVAEFLPTELPVDRIDVIIHELCHFFFNSVSDEKFFSMQKKFESSENSSARGAYNLINEVLATTLGNGLINKYNMNKKKWEKYVAEDQSFYNNYYIDRSSKAILPWIEAWIKEGKTLYDPIFSEKYISSLEVAFKNELTVPKILLNKLVLVADNKFDGKFRDIVKKEFNTSLMYSGQGDWSDVRTLKSFKEFPAMSSLLIVHSDNISQLKKNEVLSTSDYDQLRQATQKNKQNVFSFIRNKNVPVFVIVSDNYVDATKLVSKLAELKQGFSGQLIP